MWDWFITELPTLITIIKGEKKGIEPNITSKNYLAFKNSLLSDPHIARFKWRYSGTKVEIDLIDQLSRNFLRIMFKNLGILINQGEVRLENDVNAVLKSNKLKQIFNEHFNLLIDSIFKQDYFEYTVIIPLFRFSSKFPEIILAENVKLREMAIAEMKQRLNELPRHWDVYSRKTPFINQQKLYVLEIKAKFKKILVESDLVYNPFYPEIWIKRYIDIIYYFFLLYKSQLLVATFTIGDFYLQKYPPFIQDYFEMRLPIGKLYPPPQSFLSIETEQEKDDLIQLWCMKFPNFYNYFKKNIQNDVIQYAFECLIHKALIRHDDLRVFLIVSTFEGLFFTGSSRNKSGPSARNFIKLCEKEGKEWYYSNQTLTNTELEEFIKTSFRVRNNIAHPENIKPIHRKPALMFEAENTDLNEFEVRQFKYRIFDYLPHFIKFGLETFFKLQFQNQAEWYSYLRSL